MAGPGLSTSRSAGSTGHISDTNTVHSYVNKHDTTFLTPNDNDALIYDSASGTYKPDNSVADHESRITVLEGASGSSSLDNGIFWSAQAGADDDAKLTAAIAAQQTNISTTRTPPIVLTAPTYDVKTPRTMYSGLKLQSFRSTGAKDLELPSDASSYVGHRINLNASGSTISSGTSSWWNGTGGNLYNIYMADFAVRGTSGSATHQFADNATGTLYACQFHSLSFEYVRGAFGRFDRKFLMTQVNFTGHWVCLNMHQCPFYLGGSDNSLWMAGYINLGPTGTDGVLSGSYSDTFYQIRLDTMSNTNVGYVYMTVNNGWRGLKVTGNGSGLHFFGGVYEGHSSDTTDVGSGAAPGSVIRLEGTGGSFHGPTIGQAMASPNAAEGGYVHMTGGEWSFYGPEFHRGTSGTPTADTVPVIFQTGGRLHVTGATKDPAATWTTRPILDSAFTNTATSTGSMTYVPDLSLNVT